MKEPRKEEEAEEGNVVVGIEGRKMIGMKIWRAEDDWCGHYSNKWSSEHENLKKKTILLERRKEKAKAWQARRKEKEVEEWYCNVYYSGVFDIYAYGLVAGRKK